MYEGNPVDLQMEKVISADAIFDDTTRVCKVDHYDTEEDPGDFDIMIGPNSRDVKTQLLTLE